MALIQDKKIEASVMKPLDARYDRLARFYKVGEVGVRAFNNANVVILGCGALGAQHAETLARAGFGKITLIDRDFVERSNLQRQTLFTEEDAAQSLPKVVALQNHLRRINSSIDITTHIADVSSDNIEMLIKDHDLLLDGTDNLALRMLINDACYKHQIPWIFGSALESYGMSYNFNFPKAHQSGAPCLRCLLQTLPLESQDTCSSVGVIQPILQMISSIQTTEAMKFFADIKASRETLFSIDLWNFHPQNINLNQLKDSNCPTCGNDPSFPSLQIEKREAQRLCGDGSVMIREVKPLDLKKIQEKLKASNIHYQYNDYFLNIHLDHNRIILFHDGRGIVYDVDNIETAMDIYLHLLHTYS